MRVLMVTPHLPPHQAANALLPHLLGRQLAKWGHEVRFLTHGDAADGEAIAYVRRRSQRLRVTRVPQALEAAETWIKATPLVKRADVVHVHSNTWMNQVVARLAVRSRRPYVLTHYGTEIWHHDGKDGAFRRLNEKAHHVTFYSEALLARGKELRVPFRAGSVVYPPVDDAFQTPTPEARAAARARFLPEGGTLLLNVKRLHPLADHATLLEAMAVVHRRRPKAMLLIAGAGERETDLKAQVERLGLTNAVRWLGLVSNRDVAALQSAADLFVLSSILEATPTVVLEALASGTPVVTTASPGGVELNRLFGPDVTVVPKADAAALADAIGAVLETPRRVRPETTRLVDERFRLREVAGHYLALYEEASRA